MNKKALPLITILAIVVAFLIGLKITTQKYQGNNGLAEVTVVPTSSSVAPTGEPEYPTTLGDFVVTSQEICLEDSRPIIYYFGSTSCPHCSWEEPVIKKVMEKFSGLISFHNNMDNQNDQDIFAKYNEINPGYIPFLVFGCKYARVGSGESEGEQVEIDNLSAIVCKLTNGKPTSVCESLKEKISEIQ